MEPPAPSISTCRSDGNPGVECRDGGPNGQYTLVFTFGVNLTSVGSSTATSVGGFGEAMISSAMVNPSNLKQYIVNLTGVTDVQIVQVALNNVIVTGARTDKIRQFMSVLIGDTSGNRTVNSGDIAQAKSGGGFTLVKHKLPPGCKRERRNKCRDVSFVKCRSGNALPDFFPATTSGRSAIFANARSTLCNFGAQVSF